MRSALTLSLQRSVLAFTAASIFTLTGCGIGTPAGPSATTIESVSGHIHGGQTPIQGAYVVLYVTNPAATSYGAAATVIGTAYSDVYSNYTISPSVTGTNCPSGSQVYITAAGGSANYTPGIINNSMLEMAALGDCKNISSSTYTTVNELTTVAAAYALSGFTTTSYDSTNKVYKANIGAPVANNSAAGSASATAPAGLAHAFLNALNLVDPVAGVARTTFNANSGGTTTVATVPAIELNTLADALQACVNNGATGNASCVELFNDTPSLSGITPANTLQAFVYLARNPYPGATATADLINLVSATAAFQPTLATAPTDWSVTIGYHSGLAAPYFVALDYNDTAYLGLTTTSSTLPAIFGISPYGLSVPTFASHSVGTTSRGIAPDSLGNVWVANDASAVDRYTFSSGALQSTFTSTSTISWPIAVDAHNNLWVGHEIAAGAAGIIVDEAAYSSSAGAWTLNYTASTTSGNGLYGLSVDANQNIWTAPYTGATSGGSTIAEVLANTGTIAAPAYTTSGTTITPITATLGSSATYGYGVITDASGNAWEAIDGSPAGVEEIVPNKSLNPTSITPGALVSATTAGPNGNTLGTATALELTIDGAGTLFVPDNGTGTNAFHMYSTISGNTLTAASGLNGPKTSVVAVYQKAAGVGCTSAPTVTITPATGVTPTTAATVTANFVSATVITYTVVNGGSGYTGTTTGTVTGGGCTTEPTVTVNAANTIYNARQVAIDSTGSAWAGWTSVGATQTIGVAAPSYPLLSVGQPGLSPGLTAVNPLP